MSKTLQTSSFGNLLRALGRIAQAYGVELQYANRADGAALATLPDAGPMTSTLAHNFLIELRAQLGLDFVEVAGRNVTIHFSVNSL